MHILQNQLTSSRNEADQTEQNNERTEEKTKKSKRKLSFFRNEYIKNLVFIFTVFFKIGLFTFGGGLEMLPLFRKELVEKHKWITNDTLMDVISISQSIPGSLTINSAAFLGRKIAGILGSVAAISGAVFAPILCIALVIVIQPWIQGNIYVDHFFAGVRAAVAGLILSALLDLRKHVLHSKADYIVMIGSFIAMEVFNIHFIYIIMTGVLCSLFLYHLSCNNRISVAIVLLINLFISLCNYKVWYVFWTILVLIYIIYQYEIYKSREKSGKSEFSSSKTEENQDNLDKEKGNAYV